MSISGILNTATSGMLAQQTRLSNIASNIANADTPGYQRLNTNLSASGSGVAPTTTRSTDAPATQDTSNVDPLREITDMIGAENGFAANAKVFETGADMWDMLMSVKRD
ncbi:flagellar basal body rod protein [Agrobacterium vitis]|uniref:flagellar basal body rod protein FlgC n=1 Tax=Rhizobium/Agrobacterium group TaxID=227290 RepID=UPI0008DC210F|nr:MULTISPECIES: flagellar basal body protein [Rhizobium/Agrobacterium group]MCF1435189.1 flagellar basal body rod protein [Allorhizobium ampelinum]MUO92005.1 flagellar basal body rod protein [Agrobacterium vitis]MUZ53092.1 flagellar basal body rod protein [Agrobacterium vitis]MUZ91311.1 flagellar basal body rod protein [Agrobacterium vitis]MVA40245.1 flagellar basal body rod protein [Agrobacterium vitis]